MTSLEIGLAILGSSALSTLMASWFNWKLHNTNYKRDYYKKILDRRISAYEKVNDLNLSLSTYVQMDDHVIHGFSSSEITFRNTNNKVYQCINDNLWLSDDLGRLVTELNTFLLNEFSNYINDDWDEETKDLTYMKLGRENIEKIDYFKREIKKFLKKDMKSLYQIDSFFEDDKNKRSFPVYGKNYK